MKYAVFISTVPMDDEANDDVEGEEADVGVGVKGLTDEQALDRAIDLEREIVANDGVPTPWVLTEDELTKFEATLPQEKPR